MTLLSVSTFAHVLIGVRDVQRIRAEDVARQREKLAVLNRLVRHNLRHEAQGLLYVQSELPDATDEPTRRDLAADVGTVAGALTDMNDRLTRSRRLIRGDLSVLTRERDITQLTHSQGIGLWFVRWVVDALDGQFHLDRRGDDDPAAGPARPHRLVHGPGPVGR